jgi:hypothetical protein
MDIYYILYLLFIHWIADFVCQPDVIAQNKSKDNLALFFHCVIYWAIFWFGTFNFIYAFLLALIHFPIDYITSRLNSKLYAEGKIHEFFISIGFDQWIHFATILLLGKALL